MQVTQGAATVRAIGYDAAGNITSDNRLGSTYAYSYNHANRLKTVAYEGNLKGTYTYNGQHQLIRRVVTNSGTLDGTVHYVHDRGGNVIAELNAAGASVREYIWLPEAEIAPTAASRAPIDRPVAVVDGVGGANPATYYVHTDHLHRPIKMSDASKAMVWQAEYQPWGAVQSLSGPLTLDLRFPGQWFQLEAGLHYNWHRHYDPSLGRYTQADPLGFVDGPSVYGYVGGDVLATVDFSGLNRIRRPGGGRRLDPTGRYYPDALYYPPRPIRQPPNVCTIDSTGKYHHISNNLPRSTVTTFRRKDLEEIRDNLEMSIRTREREAREKGEDGPHRRVIEEQRDLLKTVNKLLSGS